MSMDAGCAAGAYGRAPLRECGNASKPPVGTGKSETGFSIEYADRRVRAWGTLTAHGAGLCSTYANLTAITSVELTTQANTNVPSRSTSRALNGILHCFLLLPTNVLLALAPPSGRSRPSDLEEEKGSEFRNADAYKRGTRVPGHRSSSLRVALANYSASVGPWFTADLHGRVVQANHRTLFGGRGGGCAVRERRAGADSPKRNPIQPEDVLGVIFVFPSSWVKIVRVGPRRLSRRRRAELGECGYGLRLRSTEWIGYRTGWRIMLGPSIGYIPEVERVPYLFKTQMPKLGLRPEECQLSTIFLHQVLLGSCTCLERKNLIIDVQTPLLDEFSILRTHWPGASDKSPELWTSATRLWGAHSKITILAPRWLRQRVLGFQITGRRVLPRTLRTRTNSSFVLAVCEQGRAAAPSAPSCDASVPINITAYAGDEGEA
ncbi:hypothetical protein NM688_g2376 [Phlebia brevispora]|uniref:Uncharacterized protein n=1 Tax=Phlebia brevispora TaxID=194682 RepID=A0ACC1T909_9APHY|nr:hypothetical protein NM688_g2376 [Phlebia brevispora]